jgi:hypothetical protein
LRKLSLAFRPVRQPEKVQLMRMIAAACAFACLATAPLAIADHETTIPQKTKGTETLTGERGTWTLHQGPPFAAGVPAITDYAIDPAVPDTGFATNGTQIWRTRDGGVTWKFVYEIPDGKLALTRIDQVRTRGGLVVATLAAVSGAAEVSTLVARSTTTGDDWDPPASSPVLPGRPGPISLGPHNAVWVAAGPVVYHSTDAAGSFSPTRPLTGEQHIDALVTGDATPDLLWVKATDGSAYRSTDAGRTWREIPGFEDHVTGPVVQDMGGAGRAVVTFFRGLPENGWLKALAISNDGGDHFSDLGGEAVMDTAGPVESYAGVPRNDELVIATRDPQNLGKDGVYVLNHKLNRLVSIDEFGISPLTVAAGERDAGVTRFHFYNDHQLWTWQPPTGGSSQVLPPVPSLERLPQAGGVAAGLAPTSGEIHVPAGKAKALSYVLTLPARSTLLDTFFLLDTSTSTKGYIDGLRLGIPLIALGFAAAGIDARYGLGEYQDRSSPDNVRYKRLAAVGPADLLRKALSGITTAGGEEPGYTAVQQALSGMGLPHPKYGAPVAPQPPGWRPHAVRTMVLIGDESFANDPAGADRDAAVKALRKSGARFVGVVVRDPDAELPDGAHLPTCKEVIAKPYLSMSGVLGSVRLRCQLEDLARASGTRAPAGGTDCDGNGTVDVAGGKPLVCTISGDAGTSIVAVAEPLRRLLIGLTDEQPAALTASDPHVTITPGGDYTKTDLKRAQQLAFTVTFSCGTAEGGQRFATQLEGLVAGSAIASADRELVCDALPKPARAAVHHREKVHHPAPQPAPAPAPPAPVPASPAAPQPATQLAVPGVPVPAPAPVPPPAPANAPSPANAPVGSSAVAAAKREEVAPVLQLIHDDDEDTELAFSPFLGMAGVLFGAVALWPLPGRTPPPLARVPTREPASRRRRRRRGP